MKTKEIALCGLFVALIAVGAFLKITIPLPLYSMHFTLQWLFVLMASLLLGVRLGTTSVAIYLCAGLIGLPVFAAGGGPQYVLRPGFGFLLGFLAAAFVMGFLTERLRVNRFWQYVGISAIGEWIYYLIGAVYFYYVKKLYVGEAVPWKVVVVEYCLITVIPDFVLCVLASKLTIHLRPAIRKMLYAEEL